MFGSYADTAFWTWFAARHELSRPLRAAAAVAWTAPAAAVAAVSVARGRITDVPRPALVRPAAPLAVLLVVRACARRRGQAPEPGRRDRPAPGAGPSRRW